MSDFDRGMPRPATVATPDMAVDAGLRAFMLGVYNKVALGLVLSAGLAYTTGNVPAVSNLLFGVNPIGRVTFTALGWLVAFAPLAILLFQGFARRASPKSANITYWVIVALIGASLGSVFKVYSGTSVFETFLITASAFGVLSLVGYTTKRDLTGLRSFLIMGVWGLVIAMMVSMFIPASGGMMFIINLLGVGIFAGLVAADAQRMKMTYHWLGGDQAAASVATSYGALSLYLDFVNLFRFLLYFTGGMRR
jgi:FtsH-binding integral membrane protein